MSVIGTGPWAKGPSSHWKRLRLQILETYGYVCQVKLPGCTGVATICHHTLGKSITGDDPTFLTAACANCNRRAGNPGEDGNPKHKPSTHW